MKTVAIEYHGDVFPDAYAWETRSFRFPALSLTPSRRHQGYAEAFAKFTDVAQRPLTSALVRAPQRSGMPIHGSRRRNYRA
jgi:hypothetical protein